MSDSTSEINKYKNNQGALQTKPSIDKYFSYIYSNQTNVGLQ